MKIVYAKSAKKYIESLDRPRKESLKEHIEGLLETPPKGDIKPLKGYSDGRLRLKASKFRIIYKLHKEQDLLYIINIGSRGDIYK